MSKTTKKVTIGDEPVDLRRFSAYKMFEATEALAAIGDAVPEVLDKLADFVGNYEDRHSPVMDRAAAEFSYGDSAMKVSEEAWVAADHKLRLPATAGQAEKVAAIFPLAFRRAREHTTRLLAVVACTNLELEEADEAGENIYADDGLIAKKRRYILHRGSTSEMINLLAAAIDACRDEIVTEVDGATVGKILDLLGYTQRPAAPAPASSGSKTGARRSSSDSRKPSQAGRAGKSSTASPGASSEPSPAG